MPSTKATSDQAEMDAILRRMLETPPKPHEPKKGREPKPSATDKAKGRSSEK